MDGKEIKKRIMAGEFAANNGKIIRTINILDGDYIDLSTIKMAQPTIDTYALNQSITYLEREGYIKIRDANTKDSISAELTKIRAAEAVLTAKGIRLAMGYETDKAVDI